jgi:iron complex transport system permease protein
MSVHRPTRGRRDSSMTPLMLLGIGLFLLFTLSLFTGRYTPSGFVSPFMLGHDPLARNLVLNLRMPRLFMAVLLGMSLGAAGQVFQMIFGNPLVEPGFLGVSQGAAFGAGFAVLFLGNAAWKVQGMAAAFAFTGLLLSYLIAHRIRFGGWILRLVLAGISVSAIFTAGVGVLKYLADPLHELPELTFWLLGGLWNVSWISVLSTVPVVVPCLAVVCSLRWRLNLLTLSDEIVHSLGVSPGRERALLLGAAVAATAAVISVCGIVGWTGLIVPHLARRMFGVDTRLSVPGSMIMGGAFTVLCDDIARTLLAGEVPLGILTSVLGAAFFLLLMSTRRREREV